MSKAPPLQRARRGRQRGVSLIELLVAFLIFSFGMLGLAGLQTKTLTYSQSSLNRSQASALIDDIFDRLRADRAHAINGDWNTEEGDTAASYTGTGFVDTELKSWKLDVETLLPAGQAIIDVTGEGVVTVTLKWDDSRKREAVQEFKTVSRL